MTIGFNGFQWSVVNGRTLECFHSIAQVYSWCLLLCVWYSRRLRHLMGKLCQEFLSYLTVNTYSDFLGVDRINSSSTQHLQESKNAWQWTRIIFKRAWKKALSWRLKGKLWSKRMMWYKMSFCWWVECTVAPFWLHKRAAFHLKHFLVSAKKFH